jgi:hypothetical protein
VASPPSTADFSFPIVPRYAEIDQQGVVFNGHYLTWFDEAFTGFLDRNVYVVVSTSDWGKRPVPDALRNVLEP